MITIEVRGPQGTGKSEIARRIAKMLLKQGETVETDGTEGLGHVTDSIRVTTAQDAGR